MSTGHQKAGFSCDKIKLDTKQTQNGKGYILNLVGAIPLEWYLNNGSFFGNIIFSKSIIVFFIKLKCGNRCRNFAFKPDILPLHLMLYMFYDPIFLLGAALLILIHHENLVLSQIHKKEHTQLLPQNSIFLNFSVPCFHCNYPLLSSIGSLIVYFTSWDSTIKLLVVRYSIEEEVILITFVHLRVEIFHKPIIE